MVKLIFNLLQIHFLDRALLGGYSGVHETLSTANLPMLGKHYNPKKPHKGILLFDVVNEYGFCMEQYLPVGKFNFDQNIEKYTPQYIMNIPDNSKYGAFLEVLFIYLSIYLLFLLHTHQHTGLTRVPRTSSLSIHSHQFPTCS